MEVNHYLILYNDLSNIEDELSTVSKIETYTLAGNAGTLATDLSNIWSTFPTTSFVAKAKNASDYYTLMVNKYSNSIGSAIVMGTGSLYMFVKSNNTLYNILYGTVSGTTINLV